MSTGSVWVTTTTRRKSTQLEKFYEENIKGKPVTIILMGDPKKIDVKAIEKKLGCKVTKLSPAKLFNSTQELMDAVM